MLVGRLVGLRLPLWTIPLEEGTDPQTCLVGAAGDDLPPRSPVGTGTSAAGQHQSPALSPHQACPLPAAPGPAGPAQPRRCSPGVWALRALLVGEQPEGAAMGSVLSALRKQDSSLLRTEKHRVPPLPSPRERKSCFFKTPVTALAAPGKQRRQVQNKHMAGWASPPESPVKGLWACGPHGCPPGTP